MTSFLASLQTTRKWQQKVLSRPGTIGLARPLSEAKTNTTLEGDLSSTRGCHGTSPFYYFSHNHKEDLERTSKRFMTPKIKVETLSLGGYQRKKGQRTIWLADLVKSRFFTLLHHPRKPPHPPLPPLREHCPDQRPRPPEERTAPGELLEWQASGCF